MPELAEANMQAGWTTVSLGDVVEVINDYWDRDTTNPERLVAGEHIDEGEMRIRRWGMTDDDLIPPTFNRRFQERDALLHSRNIDKVAQPDFGGITGEKIFILRSKNEESLLQDLIPYLVASDHFRQYAESRWAGSTNKFLNKTPLMQYEFALPPLKEQRRIVTALHLGDALRRKTRVLGDANIQVLQRFLIDSFADLSKRFELVPIEQLGELTMGRQKSPKFRQGNNPRPYMRVANIGHLKVQCENLEEMDFTPKEVGKYRLLRGDILLTEGDLMNEFNVGRPAIFGSHIQDCCFQNTLIRFRPNPEIQPFFALAILEGARLNHVFAQVAKKTTVTH